MDVLEPLAVYDVDEDGWRGLPDDRRQELAAWLREHGTEPNDTYRVELYLIDCPFIRVFQYRYNDRGRVYCPIEHDHIPGCDVARRIPFDLPVSAMPPVQPWSPA